MKQKLFSALRVVLALLLSAGLAVGGAFVIHSLPEGTVDLFAIPVLVALILLFAALLANPILAALYKKKRGHNKSVKAVQDEIQMRKDEIQKDYEKAKKKLRRLRSILTVYLILVFLLTAFVTFFSVMFETVFLYLFAFYLFLALLSRIHPLQSRPDFSNYAKQEEYPVIYGLAEKARGVIGVEGKLHICFLNENSVGIAKMGKHISLAVGVETLAILREEEIYNIFLHEFAHIKNSDTDSAGDEHFLSFMDGEEDIAAGSGITNLIFLFPLILFAYEYILYSAFASILREEKADRALMEYGDQNAAASALAKTHFLDDFENDLDRNMGKIFYEPEELNSHLLLEITEAFKAQMEEKAPAFRERIAKEIQPRAASHPILRNRLASIGVADFVLTHPEKEGAFREECRKALDDLDQKIYEFGKESYPEKRKQIYLSSLDVVKEWEENGRSYDPVKVRDLVDSLEVLHRYDDIKELCNRMIEQEAGGALNFAHFTRGRLLLAEKDPSGLYDLYYAAENNNNFIEPALNLIGEFCCKMGLEAELEEYRARSIDMLQKQSDEDALDDLTAKDKLTAEDVLPEAIRERNLHYIVEVGKGNLSAVYLVRKQITEELFCSSYILAFKKDTSDEAIRETMNAVFEFLDHDPEDLQYSLYMLDELRAAVVKKVPGCCIYKAEDAENT